MAGKQIIDADKTVCAEDAANPENDPKDLVAMVY